MATQVGSTKSVERNLNDSLAPMLNPKAQKYILLTMGSLAAFWNVDKLQPLIQQLETKKKGEYDSLMKDFGIFMKNFGYSMPMSSAVKADFHMRQNFYRYSISALKSLKTVSVGTFAATQGYIFGQLMNKKA